MVTTSAALIKVGDVIADRYRIDRVLGKGAMGVVVAATHIELRKLRAIKFMLPDAMVEGENVERFFREARAASELKSQHAVKIHDVARLPGGEPYIVMEFLEGIDFRELMKQRQVLPVQEAISYLLQAAEAVAEAHAAGIVHRDLKPANMFMARGVGGAPCVKVLDFGIAKLTDPDALPDEVHLTQTQTIMGSPLYMSPEQITSTKSVDARSDIWSLGVILYHFLTGELPFRGENAQVVFAAVQRDAPPPPSLWKPDLPPAIERIILQCLEKDPARRYSSVSQLARALTPFASQASGAIFAGNQTTNEPADTQLPTQVWTGSHAQQSFPSNAPASNPPAGANSGFTGRGTHVMSPLHSSNPMGMENQTGAPGQTNSPVVQSIAGSTAAGNRKRDLALAIGACLLTIVVGGLVLFLRAEHEVTNAQGSVDSATHNVPFGSAPIVSPMAGDTAPKTNGDAVDNAGTKNSAMVGPAKPPTTTTTTRTTAASAATTTPAIATATATTPKGPPVRRRDD